MLLLIEFGGTVFELTANSDTTFENVLKKICRNLAIRPEKYYLATKDNVRFDNEANVISSGISSDVPIYLFEEEKKNSKRNVTVTIEFKDYSMSGVFQTTDTLLTVLINLTSENIINIEGIEPSLHLGELKFAGYDVLNRKRLADIGAKGGEKIIMKFYYRYMSAETRKSKEEKEEEKKIPYPQMYSQDETDETKSEKQTNIFFNRKKYVVCYTQLEDYPYVAPKRSLLFKLPGKLNRKHQILRSFFHISLLEIGLLLEKFQTVGLGNEGKLLTSKVRDRLRKKACLQEEDIFQENVTALRICFPGGFIMQSIFKPADTISGVKHLIKSILKKPKISFFLYKIKPFQVFRNPKLTLSEAKLIPTAELYFASDYKKNKGIYIKSQLITHCLVGHSIACKVAMMFRIFPNEDNLHAASNAFLKTKNKDRPSKQTESSSLFTTQSQLDFEERSSTIPSTKSEIDFIERVKMKFRRSWKNDEGIPGVAPGPSKVDDGISEDKERINYSVGEFGSEISFSSTESDMFSEITSSTESNI